jgi:hypothetical protein
VPLSARFQVFRLPHPFFNPGFSIRATWRWFMGCGLDTGWSAFL